VDRIFINFLKVYCDPANLVLVLNTSSTEEVKDNTLLFVCLIIKITDKYNINFK